MRSCDFNQYFINKKLLLFGGASGLGEALVETFLSYGGKVFFCDKDLEMGLDLVKKLSSPNLIFQQCDISDAVELEVAISTCFQKFESIDFLFNSAANAPSLKSAMDYTLKEVLLAINTNLVAPLLIAQKVIPKFVEQKHGVIVNCSSLSAHRARPNQILYSMTKAGLVAQNKSLALEFASKNIRVHSLCPTDIDTPMLKRYAKSINMQTSQFSESRPIKRLTDPYELAEIVMFLFSPIASVMTGLDLDVTGGRLLS